MEVFSWPIRVYYEDTDAAGIVYYANYLKFMERARTEWLRHLGFEQDTLMQYPGVIFAVRSASVDYLYPARFNDSLRVSAIASKIRAASVVIMQEIHRVTADGNAPQLIARGSVKLACLDAVSYKPTPFPEKLLEAVLRVS